MHGRDDAPHRTPPLDRLGDVLLKELLVRVQNRIDRGDAANIRGLVEVLPGKRVTQDIIVPRQVELRGSLRSAHGIEGADLTFHHHPPKKGEIPLVHEAKSCVTETGGAFYIPSMAEGDYRVVIEGTALTAELAAVKIRAKRDQRVAHADLRLGECRTRVHVVDSRGARLQWPVDVTAERSRKDLLVSSVVKGEGVISWLFPGSYSFHAEVGDVAVHADGVYVGADTGTLVTLRLPEMGVLIVKVRDRHGTPVRGALVTVNRGEGRGRPTQITEEADQRGEVHLYLSALPWDISAETEDGEGRTAPIRVVLKPHSRKLIELKVDAGD
jgi:hypothetical protein